MSATTPAAEPAFVVTSPVVDLLDDPIPADWVLEGTPQARCLTWATSSDATTSHWVWDCTAGRFKWYFTTDETVVVIDGSVTISAADGSGARRLGVGDAAYFTAGTWTIWEVPDYVRKHAVLRVPVPGPLARVVRGLGWRRFKLG